MLRTGVRTVLLIVLAAVPVVLVSALALATAAGSWRKPRAHATMPGTPTSPAAANGTAANRAAARRDAVSLLTRVGLPAGAQRLASEPRDDNGYLKPIGALEADVARAVATEWWQVR